MVYMDPGMVYMDPGMVYGPRYGIHGQLTEIWPVNGMVEVWSIACWICH